VLWNHEWSHLGWWTWTSPCEGDQVLHASPLNLWFSPWNASVATPLWGKCEVATHTPENGTWESSGTPENSKRDFRGQNTSYWDVLYTVGKVLKCRCPKWPRMSHLDIYSTSYGRKKGWESNWQFDSWPLKVGNRPDYGACRQSATHHWKALKESYNFGLDLVPIWVWGKKLCVSKVPKVQIGKIRDSTLGVPGKKIIWMQVRRRAAKNTIWGKVVASLEFGPWWVKWVQGNPWLVPTPKGCGMNFNQLVGWIWMQDCIIE